MQTNTQAADPTIGNKTERLNEMAFAYSSSSALLAAIELGIFTAIAAGAGTAEDIGRRAGIHPEAADRLLIVCKALQLVREEGGRYRNLSDVERYLVKTSSTYFGDYLLYIGGGRPGEAFSGGKELVEHLTDAKTGRSAKAEKRYASLMSGRESARKFTEAGYNSSIALAHRLAKRFDFSRFTRWLDLAGGSGSYSIAACERCPKLRTIIMDNPYVLEVTREFVAKHGLEDRIDTTPGDFFKTEYPRGCDLISFITPLQGYMPEEVRKALRLAFDALEPGGTLMVVDYMLNDAKTGPLDPALMNLSGVRQGEFVGRVNSGAEFRDFFGGAGFVEIDTWWLLDHQLGVVTGRKPNIKMTMKLAPSMSTQTSTSTQTSAQTADPTVGNKTERLNEMAFAYLKSSALLAAIELGIFTAIAAGAGTAEDIGRRAGIHPEAADRLLIVCKALQLVREEGGRYRNLSDVERYLVKTSSTYFGDYLVFQAGTGRSSTGFSGGKDLVEHLTGAKTGRPAKAEKRYASVMSSRESARKFTEAGYNSSIALAHRLAKRFDFSRFTRWLDLAGGSGSYSIAACERCPKLRTIIMDHPYVLEVAREFVAKHGLEDRIGMTPGDFFKTEYPRGCDLISFITPLQGYMPEEVRKALRLAFDALEPGGTLMVVDYMLNDAKSGPLDPALWNLSGVRHGEFVGRVNSGAEFRDFFGGAGFVEIDTWWLLDHQLGVVTGRKPV